MTTRNKYSYRSKISEAKIRQIVRMFALDLNACQTAQILHLNRNTVNRYFSAFRERIAKFCEAQSPVKGEVEVDESYFGPRRVKGVRGRGARAIARKDAFASRVEESTPKNLPENSLFLASKPCRRPKT